MKAEELEAYNEGPVQGDYVIQDDGPLGAYYTVTVYEGTSEDFRRWAQFNVRRVLEFNVVLEAIQKDMDYTRYYPTIWGEDDHGELTVVNLGG